MKKNNFLGYVLVGTSLAGMYVIGHIDGYRRGFSNACNKCIDVAKSVITNHSSKDTKEKTES